MNMETINAERLSFLLNIKKEAALAKIAKCRGEAPEYYGEFGRHPNLRLYKSHKKFLKAMIKEVTCDISKLSESEGIDFKVLIADIQSNFTKTRSCVDYVMTHMDKKIQPNKHGFYPKSVNLPTEVRPFLTLEQRDKLREMVEHQFGREITENGINLAF